MVWLSISYRPFIIKVGIEVSLETGAVSQFSAALADVVFNR